MRFWKGEALGNDYLVMDAADVPTGASDTAAGAVSDAMRDLAVQLCDRHRGAGADGVLLAWLDADPVRLAIINPDGSLAEKSGNGLRIFAAFLFHRGLVARDAWFDVRLPTDTVAMRVEADVGDGGTPTGPFAPPALVRVRIGAADFSGAAVRFAPEPGETDGFELDLGDAGTVEISTVSVGNPHCVVLVDALERDAFLARAPRICTHPAFAAGTNVQFARVDADRELELWIWERGAGETLASGSSACAAAAVAVRRGLFSPGPITVRMPGGSVEVVVDEDFRIELLGPARMLFEARGAMREA